MSSVSGFVWTGSWLLPLPVLSPRPPCPAEVRSLLFIPLWHELHSPHAPVSSLLSHNLSDPTYPRWSWAQQPSSSSNVSACPSGRWCHTQRRFSRIHWDGHFSAIPTRQSLVFLLRVSSSCQERKSVCSQTEHEKENREGRSPFQTNWKLNSSLLGGFKQSTEIQISLVLTCIPVHMETDIQCLVDWNQELAYLLTLHNIRFTVHSHTTCMD